MAAVFIGDEICLAVSLMTNLTLPDHHDV